jgi:signal transduction histidine kinase
LRLSRQPTDLWSIVVHTEARLHPVAEERQITIHLEPPAGALDLEADGKLLEQAVFEVIDNAVKFTPAGGHITLRGHQEDTADILQVQDTGSGIALEQLATLLKPFTQLQRKEELGGLGIGLALVRGIIEAHGGRVTITSAGLGQGTTVLIRLPRPGEHAIVYEHGTTEASQGAGSSSNDHTVD